LERERRLHSRLIQNIQQNTGTQPDTLEIRQAYQPAERLHEENV
jgi:hypothetical protein